MKVMAVSNFYPPDVRGGYELACAQAVDALRARGHQVEVATSRACRDPNRPPHVHRRLDLVDEFGLHGLGDDPVVFRTREAASRFVNFYNVHILIELLNGFEPDVVYLHNLVGLGGLGILGALDHLGVPWLWHLGDSAPRDLCGTTDGVVPGLASQFARIGRGRYVAVSRRTLDECSIVGVDPGEGTRVVPYWITGDRPPARSRWYGGGPLRVVVAGRVDEQKGSDRIIEAAARLASDGIDDVYIDFYGRVDSPSILAMIRRHRLEGRIRLLGPTPHDELLRRYEDYDVFAFPTQEREPFGIGPVEAMARGCVPIISARCGVAEWLVHGVHCLKAPRTAEGFARVLADVRRGRVDLAPIARRAARAAVDDFHLDTLLPRIEDSLRAAAVMRRPRRSDDETILRLARLGERLAFSFAEDLAAC